MSTHSHWLHIGDLFGIAYLFERAADGIPMHAHRRELLHDVLVIRGSALIYGPDGFWSARLFPGQLFQFDSSKLHEIAALEDGTVILNVYTNGLPPGYAKLSLEERNGVLDTELTHRIDADLKIVRLVDLPGTGVN
jgi:hypothetical protein